MCGAEPCGASSHPLTWLARALRRARCLGCPRSALGPPGATARHGPTGPPGSPSWSAEFRAGDGEHGPGSQVHPSAVPGPGRTHLPPGCSLFLRYGTQRLSFHRRKFRVYRDCSAFLRSLPQPILLISKKQGSKWRRALPPARQKRRGRGSSVRKLSWSWRQGSPAPSPD